MKVDIVAAPTRSPQALVESLSLGTVRPDSVTLVSNAVFPIDNHGLNVRWLGFRSDHYAYGYRDIALRFNVAIWASEAGAIIFQGDEQIAPPEMVERSLGLLGSTDHFWGHHRYTAFADKTVPQVMAMRAIDGRPRENGQNRPHTYRSCYSGMLGIWVSSAKAAGGFDMAFNCRHAGEDQHLGWRLDGGMAFIHEPPFAWHPEDPLPWGDLGPTNTCRDGHTLLEVDIDGHLFQRCADCPYLSFIGVERHLFRSRDPLIRYDPELVEVTSHVE